MPWAPIAYPAATKILKAALDNGANFWNGVCLYSPNHAVHLILISASGCQRLILRTEMNRALSTAHPQTTPSIS